MSRNRGPDAKGIGAGLRSKRLWDHNRSVEPTPEQVAQILRAEHQRIARLGGHARAAKLSPQRRRRIAAKGGKARARQRALAKTTELSRGPVAKDAPEPLGEPEIDEVKAAADVSESGPRREGD